MKKAIDRVLLVNRVCAHAANLRVTCTSAARREA